MSAQLGRSISDYDGLMQTFRARANDLELSREEIDRIAGWADGYAGKVLSNGHAKKPKRVVPRSLDLLLGVLGLKIILIEDTAAAARTLALRVPVDKSQQRFGRAHWRHNDSCAEEEATAA